MNNSSTFAIDLPVGLLDSIRAGDLAAFERLYRLFQRPVYSLAVRMLGDPDEAMETTHDAFLRMHGAFASYRGDAPFWAWLRKIAVNETLMRLRRRNSQPHADSMEDDDAMPCSGHSPLQHAQSAELERAMAALPEITRSVLWLFHGEGYTHDEIAQLMGRTASFSKSQLARGTQRLRMALGEPERAHNSSKENCHVSYAN
ncbi:MAG: RNA polymerase sigma factor [Pseudomarimonas sp.]